MGFSVICKKTVMQFVSQIQDLHISSFCKSLEKLLWWVDLV